YEVNAGGVGVPYAVMPRCSSDGLTNFGIIDVATASAAHEFIEASTDPFPGSNSGYSGVDDNHFVWALVGGSENGDLCAMVAHSFYKPEGFPYAVQRGWSNKRAMQGHDPCAPTPATEAYFNSVPKTEGRIHVSLPQQGSATLDGWKIAAGASKAIAVDLFSDQ